MRRKETKLVYNKFEDEWVVIIITYLDDKPIHAVTYDFDKEQFEQAFDEYLKQKGKLTRKQIKMLAPPDEQWWNTHNIRYLDGKKWYIEDKHIVIEEDRLEIDKELEELEEDVFRI